MTFDEIKQRYIEGAPLDETLERLAEMGIWGGVNSGDRVDRWYASIGREWAIRPTIREAMMAAFDAE